MTTSPVGNREWHQMAAVLLIALAVPVYAVASFEGTVEVSFDRWFAIQILTAEIAIILLAFASGLGPIETWRALPPRLRIVLIAWLLVATIATLRSPFVGVSATFQVAWVVHGLFAICLWSMLRDKWRNLRASMLALFAAGLVFHSIGTYFVAWAILGPDLVDWQRYSFGTNNPRMYVYYADALLGLGLGMLVTARARTGYAAAIVVTFAAYHLFAWAGGRASFGVALLVPALVTAIVPGRRLLVAGVSYGCALVAFPLTLVTAPTHPIYGFKAVLGRIVDNALYGPTTEYSSGRFQFWEALVRQGFERPFFGHGQIGALALPDEIVQRAGAATDPHNGLVQIFHAWGFAGLVIVAVGLIPFLPSIRARLSAEPEIAWPAFIGLLALGVTAALDGTLFFNQPLFFCALFFAVLASVQTKPRKSSTGTSS